MSDSGAWRIIFDSHFHLSGDHDWKIPVTAFMAAGGTAVNLVNLPDYSIPATSHYDVLYERTARVAQSLRKDYGLHVIVSLGPYPLDYFYFRKAGIDPEKAMHEGLDLACKYIKNGNADGFGEVGRPHFPVDKEVLDFSNRFILASMETARDIDTFVMLHTEDLTPETMKEITGMARMAGMKPGRVIKHHATQELLGIEQDISKTILATKPNTRFMIKGKERAMLESDFVDDPEKPGKVIPADSVPRRALMVKNSSGEYEEIFTEIFEKLPYRAFRDEYFNQ